MQLLHSFALLSLFVAAPVPAAPAVKPADWPVFRGSPEMAGVADIKLPDQLQERWTFKTGNAIEGAPNDTEAPANGIAGLANGSVARVNDTAGRANGSRGPAKTTGVRAFAT